MGESYLLQYGIYVTRGTRHGSSLSPTIVNLFISELLLKLKAAGDGVRIGQNKYNYFAYADDISLFAASTGGLQNLINICVEYSE